MNKNFIFIIIFIAALTISAQAQSNFPSITNNNLENCEIETSKYYNGNALWGLINGGADVYLEYGFDKLLFQEVNWEGKEYRIEIYKMISSESAFGIFSISKYRCCETITDSIYACITAYQTQGAVGNYYISVSNSVGDSITQGTTFEVFDVISKQIKINQFNIPSLIKTAMEKIPDSEIKYIGGPLGIQNGFPIWSDLFDGFENFSLFFAEIEMDGNKLNIAEILFNTEDDVNRFMSHNKNDIKLEKLSDKKLFVVEGNISKEKLHSLIK